MAKSTLDQLRDFSIVVADTNDFDEMRKYLPTDATTNPSLILQGAKDPNFAPLIDEAIRLGKGDLEDTMDWICVLFGCEIIKTIPGRVSTEVDARLSFKVDQLVEKAVKLIRMYGERGVEKDRVLIKLASTWEGTRACAILENQHKIKCNMTLIFSLAQAVVCAECNATLISPFVGRIYDYYQKKTYKDPFEDPGVKSVTKIYQYYKKYGIKTSVMAASFRNIDQIKCLAGCDLLTISPVLLKELDEEYDYKVERQLDYEMARTLNYKKISYDEPDFRFELHQDEMAHFKLAEGVRKFISDQKELESLVKKKLNIPEDSD